MEARLNDLKLYCYSHLLSKWIDVTFKGILAFWSEAQLWIRGQKDGHIIIPRTSGIFGINFALRSNMDTSTILLKFLKDCTSQCCFHCICWGQWGDIIVPNFGYWNGDSFNGGCSWVDWEDRTTAQSHQDIICFLLLLKHLLSFQATILTRCKSRGKSSILLTAADFLISITRGDGVCSSSCWVRTLVRSPVHSGHTLHSHTHTEGQFRVSGE